MDFINLLLPAIEQFRSFAYAIIFLTSVLESMVVIGLFMPGTFIFIALGAVCAHGVLDTPVTILVACLGTLLGDSASFFIGSHTKNLAGRWERLLKSNYMSKAEEFLKNHGNKSVFLGRFIGPVRPLLPFLAGFLRMGKRPFFFWDTLSALIWVCGYTLIGYFFGQAWSFTKIWTTRGGIQVVLIIILLAMLYFLRLEILKRGRDFFALCRSLFHSLNQAVLNNPEIQGFVRHHPRLAAFLGGRFDRSRFSGVTLSLLIMALLYTVALFSGRVEGFIKTEPLVGLDMRLVNFLAVFRHESITRVFIWFTLLGKWEVIACFTTLFALLLMLWRKWLYLVALAVALTGSALFNLLGKMAFYRHRPLIALYPEPSSSFPSGHAAIAMAFYGYAVYFLLKHVDNYRWRMNIIFGGVLLILCVGISRLYLGVHFFSDIWAGYLLGLFWLLTGISIMDWEYVQAHAARLPARPSFAGRAWAGALLIITGMVFYAGFGHQYALPHFTTQDEIHYRVNDEDVVNLFTLHDLPQYTEVLSGEHQAPLNVIFLVRDRKALVDAFTRAGWLLADEVSFTSLARIFTSAIQDRNYPNAPLPPAFWNNRAHEIGFEHPTPQGLMRERHHVRLWRAPVHTATGYAVYVGSVSLDMGTFWGISHRIKPEIDIERELLCRELAHSGMAAQIGKTSFVAPVRGSGHAGEIYVTDGKICLVTLK